MPNPTPTPAGMTAEQQETLQQFLERLAGYRGMEVNGNYLAREASEQLARLSGMAAATASFPIESVQRDDKVLLHGRTGWFIGRWSDYDIYNNPRITHWAPLPAAPEVPGHG